jgi:hypothetical protein
MKKESFSIREQTQIFTNKEKPLKDFSDRGLLLSGLYSLEN